MSVPEAGWFVREEAEAALARREGWTLSRAFFRQAKRQTTVAAGGAGALLLLALSAGALGATYGVAALSLGLIPLAAHWERRQAHARARDAEMRQAFGPGGRFVSMMVRQGEAPTGEDRGMLWFEDGRLYFAGHRTAFGLAPAQVRALVAHEAPVPGVRHETSLVLALDGAPGPVSVSFGAHPAPGMDPGLTQGRLRAEIAAWRDGGGGGEGQWPPLGAGPGAPTARTLLGRGLAYCLLPALLPAALLGLASAPFLALAAYPLAALAMALSPGSALRWRACRDRRRVR